MNQNKIDDQVVYKRLDLAKLREAIEERNDITVVDDLSDAQLNYLCAMAEGMKPVYESINGESSVFIEKKSNSTSASYSELSPTALSKSTLAVEYNPVGNWTHTGKLIEKHKIRIFPMHEQGGKFFGWTAKALPWWFEGIDKTPGRAVVKGLVIEYLGGSDGKKKHG